MITVDIKALLTILNGYCKEALEKAALQCAARSHYEITLQHWLCALLDNERSDMVLMLRSQHVSIAHLKQQLLNSLEAFPSGNSSKPSISPLIFEWVQDAWLIASIDLTVKQVRSAALLLALIKKRHIYNLAVAGDVFMNLNENHLTQLFVDLTADSLENTPHDAVAPSNNEAPASDDPFTLYCRDLNHLAANGKIDPVFGRDLEIDHVIDVLARRRKNHPILVGFAGVGKTAIVEGFALRLNEQSIPVFLKNTRLLSLDLTALEAGASVKGEFEKRLKSLTDKIKMSQQAIILFVDEAHMLISKGNGNSDAANMLKPMLARGELRMIAATTWEEYKKYIEKDPALVRRFQIIAIDEPSIPKTIQMLRGLKPIYEQAHGVFIREEALIAAVELSSRHLAGRQQPDKAIDVLDTAAARVKLALTSQNHGWLMQQAILTLQTEVNSLNQEQQLTLDSPYAERLRLLNSELLTLKATQTTQAAQWMEAATLAHKIVDARQALQAQPTDEKVKHALAPLLQEFATITGRDFFNFEVNSDVVAQVISDWSGVPLGKLLRNESTLLRELPQKIGSRILGQSLAIQTVCERIQAAKAGLTSSEQPLGVFLLVGPSGVGKTETALACADLLYGGRQNLITINMSEFQEKHSLSRLIGSPPGYVGYGIGGVLSEAVRQRPYSVVLLDEIEKASPDIMNLFYQVFDKGQMNDGEGLEINFKNTLIFMTSNLASDKIIELSQQRDLSMITIRDTILPMLNQFLLPSLLARMTIVPYLALNLEALIAIAGEKGRELIARLGSNRPITLTIQEPVYKYIAERCQTWGGARQIDFILQQEIDPLLIPYCLAHNEKTAPLQLNLSLDAQQQWQLIITG